MGGDVTTFDMQKEGQRWGSLSLNIVQVSVQGIKTESTTWMTPFD